MGSVEFDKRRLRLIIHSRIITYGNAATPALTERIRSEIESMWNEPGASLSWKELTVSVRFRVTARLRRDITPIEIYQNVDPANNYFRIEEIAFGNISFVDGIGCNSGYFKVENLYEGSTTAAHEYGHTLGLSHPTLTDIRARSWIRNISTILPPLRA